MARKTHNTSPAEDDKNTCETSAEHPLKRDKEKPNTISVENGPKGSDKVHENSHDSPSSDATSFETDGPMSRKETCRHSDALTTPTMVRISEVDTSNGHVSGRDDHTAKLTVSFAPHEKAKVSTKCLKGSAWYNPSIAGNALSNLNNGAAALDGEEAISIVKEHVTSKTSPENKNSAALCEKTTIVARYHDMTTDERASDMYTKNT